MINAEQTLKESTYNGKRCNYFETVLTSTNKPNQSVRVARDFSFRYLHNGCIVITCNSYQQVLEYLTKRGW